jgi:hypothetical protein
VPKWPIPDPLSATVRIGARWHGGCLAPLDERPLPEIQDGTLIEIVLPAWAVTNIKEREELTSRRMLAMLPADSRVFLGLSPPAVPEKDHEKFIHLEKAVTAASYLLAEVVLIEPLEMALDGSQRATLEPCRCQISLLNMEAKSLNHALTLLSQRFEPERISHSGNVFRQGFTQLNSDRWASLDDLRFAKVAEFLHNISGTAEASLR